MKFGSLFSGVGGFDIGFERAGMECAWQAEKDKFALQVLNTHWPNIRKYEDVKDVGRNAEPVDLVCGGFPCQDLSVAGKRAGLAGERSGLWFEFRRIIEELAPTWVVIENVPGLLSSNKGGDMAVLLGGLAQLGYGWAYRVLDSQYFGVAQRRRRVFIVGHIGDATAAAKVLLEAAGHYGEFTPIRKAGETYSFNSAPSVSAQTIGWANEIAPTLKSGAGSNSVPSVFINETDVIRRLTPTECERLQGFPDGWTAVAGMSDTQRYKMMGNAVTVNVAEWIGRRIMAVA